MGNSRIRKVIAGLRQVIAGLRRQIYLHQQKIDQERTSGQPDEAAIHHWESEIRAFAGRLRRLEDRLVRRRRRG